MPVNDTLFANTPTCFGKRP